MISYKLPMLLESYFALYVHLGTTGEEEKYQLKVYTHYVYGWCTVCTNI